MINNFIFFIWGFIIINIPIMFIFEKTKAKIVLHRFVSTFDILCFTLLAMFLLYEIEPTYIIFSPIILLIACPLSYGINEELSEEDKAILVTGGLPTSLKIIFIKVVTFPFYYFVKSWKIT